MSKDNISEDILSWPLEFKKKHARSPRILHIGNIANNAYLNGKLLREYGIEVDVLCYDYYHIMGCPEWEEVYVKEDYKNDFFPIFHQKDLKGYVQPDWFIQGPLSLCFLYLFSKFKRRVFLSKCIKYSMQFFKRKKYLHEFGLLLGYFLLGSFSVFVKLITSRLTKKSKNLPFYSVIHNCFMRLNLTKNKIKKSKNSDLNLFLENLIQEFSVCFPLRQDKLTMEDLLPYIPNLNLWRKIFDHYDLIQCYSTDAIIALMTNNRPYIAFEHGTLREYTPGDFALHRLTSFAYRKANQVFITNGDSLEIAKKLGIERYSPIIHPLVIKIDNNEIDKGIDSNQIKKEYQADILLFCPIRHDWDTKGTDLCLRALPGLISKTRKKIVLILVLWGQEISKSKKLIEELNLASYIHWLKPVCRLYLLELMKAADVVLDQMALPHFGGTAPQALAVRTPVIMSYKSESTSWIVSKPAPILPAFSSEDIEKAVIQALDPIWISEFRRQAESWIKEEHHPFQIVTEHIATYKKLLD